MSLILNDELDAIAGEADAVFARFAAAQQATAAAIQRAEYVELLKRFDWQFEFADDFSVVRAGREQLRRLRELQPFVDADRALFNAARPNTHGSASL